MKSDRNKTGYSLKLSSILLFLLISLNLLSASNPCLIKVNNLWGFIDSTGRIVIKPEFIEASNFFEGFALVKKPQGKYFYIRKDGTQLMNYFFDRANDFSEGLAGVCINGKYGFMDTSGTMIIKPEYEDALYFSSGIAFVNSLNYSRWINRKNKTIIKERRVGEKFREYYFDDGYSVGYSNRIGYYYRNTKGRKIKLHIRSINKLYNFSERYAGIKINTNFGFINKKFKLVIPAHFEDILYFHEGLAAVKINSKWGFIDTSGSFILQPRYSDVRYGFSEGKAIVKDSLQWKIIDISGNEKFHLSFEPLSHENNYYLIPQMFHNGLLAIIVDNKLTYINKEGIIIWKGN